MGSEEFENTASNVLSSQIMENNEQNSVIQGLSIVGNQTTTEIYEHNFSDDNLFPDIRERKPLNQAEISEARISDNDFTITYETTATINGVENNGSYRNTLGHYEILEDGTIQSAKIAFENTKKAKNAEYTFDVSGENEIGFFIIANGDKVNKKFKDIDLDQGEIKFVFDLGGSDERLAKISDNAADVTLVHENEGVVTEIKGHTYHAFETSEAEVNGQNLAINADGKKHAISGLLDENDPSTLRVGFEDLYNLGDADFNDVVFNLTVETKVVEIVDENDNITGTDNADLIVGESGDDILNGEGGDDEIIGNSGEDVINGGAGNDKLNGNNDNDTIFGDSGDDTINGGTGSDLLRGGDDNDTIYGAAGLDTIYGDAGEDRLFGNNGNDTIYGGDDNDLILGDDGQDLIYGDDGDDEIYGGADSDTIFGGIGNDEIHGEGGNNTIDAGHGNDSVFGGDNVDIITLGEGDDRAEGGAGRDVIDGGLGADLIYGGADNDTISGGAGDDILFGDTGNDILTGGAGLDLLYGGDNSDIFKFTDLDENTDQIRDFTLFGNEKDFLDISDLLSGYGPDSQIEDFVLLRTRNADRTDLFINQDGEGRDWVQASIIRGSDFTGVDAGDLINSGQLVVDPSTV